MAAGSQVAGRPDLRHWLRQGVSAHVGGVLKNQRSGILLATPRYGPEIDRGREAAFRADDAEAGCLEQFACHADDGRDHLVVGRQRPKEPENEIQFWLPSLPQPLAFDEERSQDRIATGDGQRILQAWIRAAGVWG